MQYLSKIYSDQLSENDCVICHARLKKFLEIEHPFHNQKNNTKDKMEIRDSICSECYLIQRDPMPSESDLDDFYSGKTDVYFDLASGDKFETDMLSQRIKADQFQFLHKWISESDEYKEIKNLVEIGAFEGAFLQIAQQNGMRVEGFEPSNRAKAASKRLGQEIRNEFFSSKSKLSFRPDVFVFLHVLEHVTNPVIFIKDIISVSKNAGQELPLMFIEVPNIEKFPSNDIGFFSSIDHTYNFTPSTFKMVIAKAGCKLLRLDISDNRPIMRAIILPSDEKISYEEINKISQIEASKVIKTCYELENNLSSLDKKIDSIIEYLSASNEKLVIYASGIHTQRLLSRYPKLTDYIESVVDSDSSRTGDIVIDLEVKKASPEILKDKNILISSYGYQEDIYNYLISECNTKKNL